MPLLTRSRLDPNTDAATLAQVGNLIHSLGLTKLINHYWGDLMMRKIGEVKLDAEQ